MSNSIYDTFSHITSGSGNKMYGNPICHVYIADGFQDDCEDLIQRCILKHDVLEYHMFCRIWKEMNMGCLYQGRTSAAEVAELSEELLHIAKHYMVANTSIFEESVAGLFLVYSLMHLQPYQNFASLRLVPEDIPAIKRLESLARRDRRYDVLYILASILIKGPCQFHAAERERGMEPAIKKYLDGFKSIDSVRGVRPKGVFYRQNEELDLIRELGTITKKYSEAKAEVVGPNSVDKSLQYIDENLSDELSLSFKNLLNGKNEDDDEADEENVKSERDHVTTVEEIKFKAMKEAVNPVKHLTGIADRKRLKKTKPEMKKDDDRLEAGRILTSNTTEPDTCDLQKKRQSSPKGNKNKKLKINEEGTSDVKDEDDLDAVGLHKTHSDVNNESSGTEDENAKTYGIKSLPMLMSNNIGTYEIETITENENNKSKEESITENERSNLPDINSIGVDKKIANNPSQDENSEDECMSSPKFNEDEQEPVIKIPKKLKKTQLKSKLKRLGMLNLANLDD